MGRPSSYTDEIAAEICALMVDGLSLRQICRKDEMPHVRTIYRWLEDLEPFRHQYAQARRDQAENYAQEIIDIADEAAYTADPAVANAARLRVDARKWVTSKLLPKVYGDRTELVGKDGKDLIPGEVDSNKLALALLNILNANGAVEPKD